MLENYLREEKNHKRNHTRYFLSDNLYNTRANDKMLWALLEIYFNELSGDWPCQYFRKIAIFWVIQK